MSTYPREVVSGSLIMIMNRSLVSITCDIPGIMFVHFFYQISTVYVSAISRDPIWISPRKGWSMFSIAMTAEKFRCCQDDDRCAEILSFCFSFLYPVLLVTCCWAWTPTYQNKLMELIKIDSLTAIHPIYPIHERRMAFQNIKHATFTFTFRAFSRRFYNNSIGGRKERTIYHRTSVL